MLFDINQYNQYVLFFTFVLFTGCGIFFFKSKYVSVVDPITLHILWIASHLAFLVGYMYKNGASVLPIFFFINMIIYVLLYHFFLKSNKVIMTPFAKNEQTGILRPVKVKTVFLILVIVNIISKASFFKYILLNPNISSWVLYRFVDMQGRDPLLRILSTASSTYLLFYAFILFAIVKKWRYFVIFAYAVILCLEVFAGGRAVLLSIIFNFGMCIFYFREYFNIKDINRFTKKGFVYIAIAFSASIVVTSFYDSNYSISDGLSIVTNRLLAAGDGLEYYMNYDGIHKIKSGIVEYIYSVFGIYLKRITGGNYKNIGLQLSELVLGDLEFTQGSNYTFLLQIMVIGYQFFIIYIPIIAYCTAKLRTIKFNSKLLFPLSFFLSATSYLIPGDLEFWVLNVISGVLFFYIVIYPINKLSFKAVSSN